MKSFVFNGWAAEHDVWARCTFERTRIFDYVELMDGVAERELAAERELCLIGFSMGGSTALQFTADHPEKVRALILVSATACMMAKPGEGWAGMSPRRCEALLLGTRLTSAGNPSPLFSEVNLMRGLDYLRQTDLRQRLMTLPRTYREQLPVHIFQSMRDGIVRPSNADFLKALFPHATVRHVEGSEHTLPRTIPSEIDAAVSTLLKAARDE